MALTDLHIVTRSLRVRVFSTATTVALVGISVALMLTLLSMREAGRRAFERGTGNMQILVSADSSPLVSVLNSVFYANAPQRPLRWSQYEKLFPRGADGGVADRRVEFAIPVQQGDSFRGYPTMATVPEFFTAFQPSSGEPFALAAGTLLAGDYDVVLGSEIARSTGMGVGSQMYVTHGYSSRRGHAPAKGDTPAAEGGGAPAKAEHHHDEHDHDAHDHAGGDAHGASAEAGKEEDIHDEFPFTVVGVLKPTGSPHDRAVFIHMHATWMMHADEKRHALDPKAEEPTLGNLRDDERLITGIYVGVRTRPGSDVSASTGPLFAALRADPSLTIALPGQEIKKLFTIVSNVDQIFLAMAAAVMVCSGIAVMLALYNSMEQRRRQIAVLRVLGASRARVFGLILTESALIGLAGAVAGVLLCLAGVALTAEVMQRQLGLVIDAAIEPRMAVVVIAGTLVLACLAGVVPAWMGYRTSVARNLRPFA